MMAMKIPSTILLAFCFLSLGQSARAQACGDYLVEGFTYFSNIGNWVWHGTFHVASVSGGNPGYHVQCEPNPIDLPSFSTTDPSSYFCGDWRGHGVTSTGIDFQVFDADPAACDRPLTVQLEHDNGTPGDPLDDFYVYRFLGRMPCVDLTWHSFTVDVDSASNTLPPGWLVDPNSPHSDDLTWQAVMGDVSRIRWFLGNPLGSYPANGWSIGADNPRLGFNGGPSTLCSAQRSSLDCSPSITWTGLPSASSPFVYEVKSNEVVGQQFGFLLYGYNPGSRPFLGGELCLAPPLIRTPVQSTGGKTGACDGELAFNFNAWIQSGIDPLLVAGAVVYCQYWSRDPGAATGSSLTNGLRFSICP